MTELERNNKQTSNKAYQTQATVNICQGYDFLENSREYSAATYFSILLNFRPTDRYKLPQIATAEGAV